MHATLEGPDLPCGVAAPEERRPCVSDGVWASFQACDRGTVEAVASAETAVLKRQHGMRTMGLSGGCTSTRGVP
jgi:hypothetical protein